MHIVALDTETHAIAPRTEFVRGTQKVKTSPMVTPRLVLGTFAHTNEKGLGSAETFTAEVWRLLQDPDTHLVFHNATFDIEVLCAHAPELRRPFEVAIEGGRVHDTMVLDLRHRLALGVFDRPVITGSGVEFAQVRNRSLAACAEEHLGLALDKDEALRLGFGAWEGRVDELPPEMAAYALQDAVATLDLYTFYSKCNGFPWDEALEVQASVAMYQLDKRGVRIDREEAKKLRALFEKDLRPLELKLVEHGLGQWRPNGKRVRLRIDGQRRCGSRSPDAGCGAGPVTDMGVCPSLGDYIKPIVSLMNYGKDPPPKEWSAVIDAMSPSVLDQSTFSWAPIPIICETVRLNNETATNLDIIEPKNITQTGEAEQQVLPKTDGPIVGARLLHYKKHSVVEFGRLSFHLMSSAIRDRLAPLAGPETKRTPSGLLSIVADDWADEIPTGDEGLTAWLDYAKLQKTLTSYLGVYSEIDYAYPRWHVTGARSGRMSASSPAIQQIPKRRNGIRSLFLARPEHVLIIADYSQAELLTLAQAILDMGIRGPLLEGIRAGRDLHTQTAEMLWGRADKAARQGAKAINFGVPGFLGPKKLAEYARKNYGVSWTVEEAKEMRQRYLAAYPDVAAFLRRCQPDLAETCWREFGVPPDALLRSIGAPNWWEARRWLRENDMRTLLRLDRSCTTKLRTGLVRSRARVPEAANTFFQGLSAAVTKRAVWRAGMVGLKPILVVHDEIVVETVPLTAAADCATLETCMKQAFIDICPDVGPFSRVESAVRERWGKATDKDGKDL